MGGWALPERATLGATEDLLTLCLPECDRFQRKEVSDDLVNPAVRISQVPELDAEQLLAQPHAHRASSMQIRPSDAGMPSSGASVSSACLVMPGSSVPVSAGVMIRASEPEP